MDFLLDALTQWLKEMLVGGIMGNLSGMFDSVNQQVADIATQVGQTPQGWNGSIFSMIQNLSNSIMVPIAGVILAIVMTLELIQMITDRNNLHDVDTWMIFKWVFKSAAAILIVTNTWNIVMGVFDMAQSVVAQAAGIIGSDASIDISSVMGDMETRLMEMDLGPLIGLWAQSLVIGITMWALYICIFIVIYGRMIEIYLWASRRFSSSSAWRFMPCWYRISPLNPTSSWLSGAVWAIRSCCALRSLRPEALQKLCLTHTNQEGGNPIGLCTRTQGSYESQNQGRVQFNQEAAGLLQRRGAHRRTAFLPASGACGKQRGSHVYDACHAALLHARHV